MSSDLVDIMVPGLGPDLFRFIGHNGDGELQKGEWGVILHTAANASTVTLLDKDNSKTVEVSELVEFFEKLINIAIRILKTSINTCWKAAESVRNHDTVNTSFEMFDGDQDGKLTIKELTLDYDKDVLGTLMAISRTGAQVAQETEKVFR